MTPARRIHIRTIALRHKMVLAPIEAAYERELGAIMEGLHEAFVDTLLVHRKLRTGFVDTFEVLGTDALGDDPLGWITLGTAGASIEVHFLTQVPGKVGRAFNKIAPKIIRGTRELATLQGISPNAQGLGDVVRAAREANIQLIEKAGREYAADVRAVFEDPANYNLSADALKDLLVERGNISVRHARMIARDQVLKLSAALNKHRQLTAGVEEYDWSGVMDRRERDSHVALEGRRFRWDQPTPIGYHPGEDYECRCIAIAFVPELEGL